MVYERVFRKDVGYALIEKIAVEKPMVNAVTSVYEQGGILVPFYLR